MHNNKIFSRILGLLIIIFSTGYFIFSLKSQLSRETEPPPAPPVNMRITGDVEKGEIYLWGAGEGMYLKGSVSISYKFEDGFYIISLENLLGHYTLEVYEGKRLVAVFQHERGEKYPILPD